MRKLLILGLLLCTGLVLHAEEFGIASYYSDAFHGRKTASGALYHKDKLTAAHKSLPFGTIVRVTRLDRDNKPSVKVTINDRGPFVKNRIIDLSKAAAVKLDMIEDGKVRVKIEVLKRGDENLVADAAPVPDLSSMKIEKEETSPKGDVDSEDKSRPTTYSTTSEPKNIPDKRDPVSGDPAPDTKNPKLAVKGASKKGAAKKEKAPAAATKPKAKKDELTPKNIEIASKGTLVKGSNYQDYDLYKIQLMRPAKGGYGVQVASLTNYENVMKQVAQLQEKWFNNILVSVEPGKNNTPIYKLILGPFPDKATADSYKKDLKSKKKMEGFVVDLSKLNN